MSDQVTVVLLAGAGLMVAGLVKGMVGVGFPVVAMSILTLFIDPVTAIGIVAIPVLATNAWQALQVESSAEVFRRFWPLITMLVVGTWMGGLAIAHVDVDIMLAMIGLVAIGFSIFSVAKPDLVISSDKERWCSPVTGLGAGVIGGLTTVHGPPIMMYLMALGLRKDEFVGTIGLIWFCGSLPMVSVYIYKGVINLDGAMLSLLSLLPVFLGLYAGGVIRGKINQEMFKNMVIAALFFLGINLIRRSVF